MTIGQRIDEAARDATVDDDTWMRLEARGRRLELALKDPHGTLAEAKATMDQAEDRWGATWQSYVLNEGEIARQRRRDDDGGGYGMRAADLQGHLETKRQYEAPRGAS